MTRLRELGESLGGTVLEGLGRAAAQLQEQTPLPADLLEAEDRFLAVFDAPGVEAEDVKVRFENGVLRVQVDRFRGFYDGFEMRLPGRGMSLDGEVALPADAEVDPTASTAAVTETGTLRVELPKVDTDVTHSDATDLNVDDEPPEDHDEE